MDSARGFTNIEKLKRLVYAANKRELANYLQLSEYGPNNAEAEVRIAIFGIETSVYLLYQGLTCRPEGFDWDNDTIDPSDMTVDDESNEIVDNAIDIMDNIEKKKAEAKLNVRAKPEPMDMDPTSEDDIQLFELENNENQSIRGNVIMIDSDAETEVEEDYKDDKYDENSSGGNPTLEHYRFMDGGTDLKIKRVKLFMIPSKFLQGHFLIDKFKDKQNNGHEIDLVITYNSQGRYQLLYDPYLGKNNYIYQCNFEMVNHCKEPDEWWDHISKFLLIHVILSVSHYKWKNLQIRALFPFNKNSIITSIVSQLWREHEQYVMEEMEFILKNPESVFCENCSPACEYKGKNWHINIAHFVDTHFEQQDININHGGTFCRSFNMYQGNDEQVSRRPLFRKLKDLYNEQHTFGKDSVKSVLDLFIDFWSAKEIDKHYTYLFVLVDDPEGLNGRKTPVKKLLETQDVFLYVGRTRNQRYRRNHFVHTKPIDEVHGIRHKLTRVFVARNCETSDIRAVAFDEAYILVFIWALRDHYLKDSSKMKLNVINQKSGSEHMFGCKVSKLMEIQDFIDNGTDLFDPESKTTAMRKPGVIDGRWGLCEITDEIIEPSLKFREAMKMREIIKKRNTLKERGNVRKVCKHKGVPRLYDVSSSEEDE